MKKNNQQDLNENNDNLNLNKTRCCEKKHHGFVGGIILMSIGVIFLLNNFGLLPWSVWSILWKFWPLFLILGGIEMVIGGGWLAELLIGLITLSVVTFIIIQVLAFNNYSFKKWVENKLKWFPLNEKIFIYPRNQLRRQFFNGEGYEN